MSLSLSTARWLAPASFIYNVLAQTYGLLSTPNMLDIHNANISFFSPAPFLIAPFFFIHQVFQLAWLYHLFRGLKTNNTTNPNMPATKKLEPMLTYVPYLITGNICIGTWMFFWNASHLGIADLFVLINTLAQTAFVVLYLPRMNIRSTPSVLTHLVAKTYLGLSILDVLHNTSIAFFKDEAPGLLVKVLTAFGFALVASMSDWILGAGLVYALMAFAVGQGFLYEEKAWGLLLGVYAVSVAGIVGVRNYARPPYTSQPDGYVAAAGEEEAIIGREEA